nr:hypothetical protein [uncultured Bacillus sp.]
MVITVFGEGGADTYLTGCRVFSRQRFRYVEYLMLDIGYRMQRRGEKMIEHKVQWSHFVREDGFELNLYLTYLFQQFKSRCSSQMKHGKNQQITKHF